MKLTTRPDLQPALAHFIRARDFRLLRMRDLALFDADHGTGSDSHRFMSGGCRPHWPESAKATIRSWIRQENEARDSGFAARPPRVRSSTMRAIYQLVMK